MPILVGTTSSPPAPPVRPRRSAKRILWTSAAGDVLDLTGGQGYVSLPGREGFGLPTREASYRELAEGGADLADIVDQVRLLNNGVSVKGATAAEYQERLARLQAAMLHPRRNGTRVPGTITVQLPDGTIRTISAYYNTGLSGAEERLDDHLTYYQEFPNLEFLAVDPYWSGGQMGEGWGATPGQPWFGAMPRALASSAVLGSVTTVLRGDAETWPIWTIVGPGAPSAQNLTAGRGWAWRTDSPIPSGRVVTIDTRPTVLTVIDDLGNDLWEDMDDYPDLWPLEPGANDLMVTIDGATGASRASYTADIRWQAGW